MLTIIEYSNKMAWRHRPVLLHPPQRAEVCGGGFEGQNKPFKLLLQVSSRRLFFITAVPFWLNTSLSCIWLNIAYTRIFCIRSTLTEVRSVFPQVFLSSLGKNRSFWSVLLDFLCTRMETPCAPKKSGPKIWPALVTSAGSKESFPGDLIHSFF